MEILNGFVYDSTTKEPIKGAKIQQNKQKGKTRFLAETSTLGDFSLVLTDGAKRSIHISKKGYKEASFTFYKKEEPQEFFLQCITDENNVMQKGNPNVIQDANTNKTDVMQEKTTPKNEEPLPSEPKNPKKKVNTLKTNVKQGRDWTTIIIIIITIVLVAIVMYMLYKLFSSKTAETQALASIASNPIQESNADVIQSNAIFETPANTQQIQVLTPQIIPV